MDVWDADHRSGAGRGGPTISNPETYMRPSACQAALLFLRKENKVSFDSEYVSVSLAHYTVTTADP